MVKTGLKTRNYVLTINARRTNNEIRTNYFVTKNIKPERRKKYVFLVYVKITESCFKLLGGDNFFCKSIVVWGKKSSNKVT